MYTCPFCVESYDTVGLLKVHCKMDHYAKVQSVYACKQESCSRKFSDIHALFKHFRRNHPETIIATPGAICNKQSPETLKRQAFFVPDPPPPKSLPTSAIACTIASDMDEVDLTPELFAKNVAAAAACFVANLYSRPSVPRNFVQEMITSVQGFFECISVIEAKYHSTAPTIDPSMTAMFKVAKNSFVDFSSEYKTLQYFKSLNCLIEPDEICIGASLEPILTEHGRRMVVKDKKIYSIPIKKVFRLFLELPGVYDVILENIESYKQSASVASFIQGSLWSSIEQRFDGIVLPLILYYDDLEINNPLGTHRGVHKLGAVYCSIDGIPKKYASILENIFLLQLHNSKDYAELGNKQIFSHLVSQVTELQTEGISVTIRNDVIRVYFALVYVLGDNLGLNAIFGFTTSFNSHYSCRGCVVEKSYQQIQTSEDPDMLRTVENYAKDVLDKTRGINEECIFNSIPYFHIANNISFDPMHDVFEGICRYDLGKLLQAFIKKDKFFSLETLNNRIKFFDYGSDGSENVPTTISADAVKKGYIIYSASEMACFLRHLGILIGDLIPKKNKTWRIYIILRRIVSIILASEVTHETINTLKKLTTEHHKLYQKLFDDTLKPKHHLLLHYPRAMEQSGPMNQMSCMRFEAKHKELKDTAKAITSRKNPAYTLALKQQLQMNYRFVSRKGFDKNVKTGIVISESVTHLESYADLKPTLPPELDAKCRCISWIKICGTVYKPKMIISVLNVDCEFGKINYILIDDTSNVNFIYKTMKIVAFSEHYFAYEVKETNSWGFVPYEELVTHVPCNVHVSPRGITYVPVVP